jgi:glycosyltransferase involved in cell wall biosynthesis
MNLLKLVQHNHPEGEMKKVLLVGEHPLSVTGNGNMMSALLKRLDHGRYVVSCFVADVPHPSVFNMFQSYGIPIINAQEGNDSWGKQKLLYVLKNEDIDIVVFVGIDIWRYADTLPYIKVLQKKKKFKTVALFPYDLQMVRKDWLHWIKQFDYPYVYSKWGFELLKKHIPNLGYFRPPVNDQDLFYTYDAEKREKIRKEHFPSIKSTDILVGIVAANSIRKDLQRQIKAFSIARRTNENIFLYLHTSLNGPVYNIKQYCEDCGLDSGSVFVKNQDRYYTNELMADIYNSLDILLNCSMQEGLSWTPINAMMCGTPVIVSNSTAHIELVNGGGERVPCYSPAFVPLPTIGGDSWIESFCCHPQEIANAITRMAHNVIYRNECAISALEEIMEWMEEISDINLVLDSVSNKDVQNSKKKAILFVQHSSAGDVLMSTQCFKGIKERHPNLPLHYMTQEHYMDIVTDNPYIDELIKWDEELISQYEIVYNPHGEKILPGGFNNLDVTLYSMYPHFCKVEADKIYINEEQPNIKLPNEYIVVNTAGADKKYRSYEHMDIALAGFHLPIIQIGATSDPACECATLDLRGKLTFRESAYVMARASAAVVIDSFPMHLAGAVGTRTVALFGPAPARVTQPKNQHTVYMCFLEPDKLEVCPITSNCWGRPGYMQCESPCINTINPMEVRESLEYALTMDGRGYVAGVVGCTEDN